jgi:hypothetical protein
MARDKPVWWVEEGQTAGDGSTSQRATRVGEGKPGERAAKKIAKGTQSGKAVKRKGDVK